jgi:hypothetical protein
MVQPSKQLPRAQSSTSWPDGWDNNIFSNDSTHRPYPTLLATRTLVDSNGYLFHQLDNPRERIRHVVNIIDEVEQLLSEINLEQRGGNESNEHSDDTAP